MKGGAVTYNPNARRQLLLFVLSLGAFHLGGVLHHRIVYRAGHGVAVLQSARSCGYAFFFLALVQGENSSASGVETAMPMGVSCGSEVVASGCRERNARILR